MTGKSAPPGGGTIGGRLDDRSPPSDQSSPDTASLNPPSTAVRRRLPDRRGSVTFDLVNENLKFTCTVSRGADGSVLEVFLKNHKAGSMAGITASDAAVSASLALQFGCPFETLRRALMRDPRGKASGPLGAALDQIAGMQP